MENEKVYVAIKTDVSGDEEISTIIYAGTDKEKAFSFDTKELEEQYGAWYHLYVQTWENGQKIETQRQVPDLQKTDFYFWRIESE